MTGMLRELLGHDGVEEDLVLRQRIGVMAYHGGNLEKGTDQIATAVAEAAGASLYTVRQPDDLRWHVPSTAFVPDESDALAEFLDHVSVAVTIHGYGREAMWTHVLLGGRNRPLATRLGTAMRDALPDYTIVDDLEEIPAKLRGVHAKNPVNLPAYEGVQIELPPRIRGWGPYWADWSDGWPTPHTAALIDAIASVLADGVATDA